MSGNDIVITAQTILSIFGGLAIVVTGITSITKMMSPFKDLKVQVEKHENEIKEIEEDMDRACCMQREICKCLLVMMNHEITGNSVDKLKERQEDLQKFLIDN